MKYTFKEDSHWDEKGYCPKGMIVDKAFVDEGIEAKNWEQDFVPVVITEVMDWNEEFIEIDPQKDWFHKNSFEEHGRDWE